MTFHDHVKEWLGHIRHISITVGVLAALIAGTLGLLEVRAAVKHSEETRAAEVKASSTAQKLPDAPLEKHLFAPNQKPLAPHVFKPPAHKVGEPYMQPQPPSPEGTIANPNPEVTTATDARPQVNVYDPESPRDAKEIEETYSIDLKAFFPISQRKSVDPLPYGAKAMLFIPAGGGDAFMLYRANPRPKVSFRPVFDFGAGAVASWDGGSPMYGATARLSLDFLRVGDWHTILAGDFDYLPTAPEKPLRVRGSIIESRRFGSNN